MEKDYDKLDNPAWHSLSETHQPFAAGINNISIKFYNSDYCPFGGLNTAKDYQSTLMNTLHSFLIFLSLAHGLSFPIS